jgi:hypothetical protein
LGSTTTVSNTQNKKTNNTVSSTTSKQTAMDATVTNAMNATNATGKKTDKSESSTTSTQSATDNNVTRKGKTGEIPDYSDDDSSRPGNYAVKKFIGYKEFMKGGIKLSYIPGGKDGEMQNL